MKGETSAEHELTSRLLLGSLIASPSLIADSRQRYLNDRVRKPQAVEGHLELFGEGGELASEAVDLQIDGR